MSWYSDGEERPSKGYLYMSGDYDGPYYADDQADIIKKIDEAGEEKKEDDTKVCT